MTEELILQLIAAGLSKQQARSAVAEKITNYYMNDDGKILIAEAKRQVDEMRSVLDDLKRDYYELKQAMQLLLLPFSFYVTPLLFLPGFKEKYSRDYYNRHDFYPEQNYQVLSLRHSQQLQLP